MSSVQATAPPVQTAQTQMEQAAEQIARPRITHLAERALFMAAAITTLALSALSTAAFCVTGNPIALCAGIGLGITGIGLAAIAIFAGRDPSPPVVYSDVPSPPVVIERERPPVVIERRNPPVVIRQRPRPPVVVRQRPRPIVIQHRPQPVVVRPNGPRPVVVRPGRPGRVNAAFHARGAGPHYRRHR